MFPIWGGIGPENVAVQVHALDLAEVTDCRGNRACQFVVHEQSEFVQAG